ncbi:MAG: hypothetical protein EZS28_007325 [Streblomastix strix]|uniref:Uncharacterized protein n=1 Tax=Streblomastix strix TaxID=222440 RepID=A0A5J4WSR7_9EUKA|nr:MAG: hypothetical protein EZS28_007325 [Streblomastix strix]
MKIPFSHFQQWHVRDIEAGGYDYAILMLLQLLILLCIWLIILDELDGEDSEFVGLQYGDNHLPNFASQLPHTHRSTIPQDSLIWQQL